MFTQAEEVKAFLVLAGCGWRKEGTAKSWEC
jgi:hypothetical protein